MSRLSFLVLLPLLAACDDAAVEATDATAIGASKVEVCHLNSGTYGYALIDVAESSVSSHFGHGDTLFSDDANCDGFPDALDLDEGAIQCLNDAGYASYADTPPEALCDCDCGHCFDCGLDTFANQNGCECAPLPPALYQ